MINSVTMVGHVGKDPELHTAESGTSIVRFPFAYHEFRQQNGERQNITHWFNCVAFGNLATICSEFMHKGAHIAINGNLKQRSYENKEGEKRNSIEIHLRDVEFLGTKNTEKSAETK